MGSTQVGMGRTQVGMGRTQVGMGRTKSVQVGIQVIQPSF